MHNRAIGVRERPGLRHWRDLSKRWLLFGLVLAPLFPIALGAFILLLLGAGIFFATMWPILAAAEIWSMLGGTLFLFLSRWSGGVRRAHCLLLGAFLAFSLPAAAMLTSKAVDWFTGTPPAQADGLTEEDFSFHGPTDTTLVLILSLVLIPFGTLGGWVFWRVGAYSARPRVIDVAPVFD